MRIDPDRLPRLSVPFMNGDHLEEARLINVVADRLDDLRGGKAGPDQVNAAVDALYGHTREHFTREESAMANASFPAHSIHQAEHVRILGELGEAQRRFQESGKGEELAAYLAGFPEWFEQHIASMDAATARYLAEWGG
jgi:hemerythrin-like metal-binding protein